MAVIFFDIDGTLTDEDCMIPDSAVEAIHQMQRNGSVCLINTGRPHMDMDDNLRAVGFDGFVCSCGQYVSLGGQVLLHEGFSPETSRAIAEMGRVCRMDLYYESESGNHFDRIHRDIAPELVRALARFTRRGIQLPSSAEDDSFCCDKLAISYSDDSLLPEFLAFIAEHCEIIDRGERMYELPKRGFSKATGCAFAAKALGVELSDCYAVGDSTNDLSMLACVGHPIVMGHAPMQVRQAAEYVTGTVSQDGLYHAMQHMGLL